MLRGNITATVGEAIDRVGGVCALVGGVEVEVGVGGERRKERFEIGLVDAIIGAESGVFTYGVEMNRVSSMSGKAEEGKNGKEQNGKREGIEEESHFDYSISSSP